MEDEMKNTPRKWQRIRTSTGSQIVALQKPIKMQHLDGDPASDLVPEFLICELDYLKDEEANATLICDAVNNTAGKGIDPKAVPGLLKTLIDMVEMKSTPDHIRHYAKAAIKKATQ